MKTARSLYLLSAFLTVPMVLQSCYPPNQPGVAGEAVPAERYATPIVELIDAAEDLSVELKEKGLPNQVEAWVDDLIVTAQPGADMPEVTRLKSGESATYLHQRTLLRKEAVLRGQRFKARYILIRLSTGQMGWVHEGGVRYVYPQYQKVLDEIRTVPASSSQRMRGLTEGMTPTDLRIIVPGIKVGPITRHTSQEDLVELYGGTQVGLSTITTPEGEEGCTVIFPGEPSELRITWKDTDRTRIKAVYIDKSESTWFTREGMGVGLPLSEIAKVNQHPFRFYGLNWQYGGVVEDWNNGTMARYKGKCYAVMAVSKSDQGIPSFLEGDQLISSNEAGIDGIDLVLSRLVIYLD